MLVLANTGDTITYSSDGGSNSDILISYNELNSTSIKPNRNLYTGYYNSIGGANFTGQILQIIIDSNGKILIGGVFTTFTGSTNNGLIRLNPNGTKDTSFNIGTGFNSSNVTTIAIDSNNKILVGGNFTKFTGSTNNGLIRLNSNGTKDTSFNIGSGFNSLPQALAIDSNGKILVGGQFNTYTGSTNNYLIRLNSDGTKDTSFNIGSGFNSYVNCVAVQPDGKILVGGVFTTFTGSTNNNLIRLNSNGTKDTSFNIGTGFNNYVNCIAVQPDGKILVGGQLTTFTGSTNNGLIRLNSNGTKDTSFNIGSGFSSGTALIITSITIDSNGKILVGGQFNTYTGTTNNNLIRLNSNGTKDTSFNIGTGFDASISTLAIDSYGKILVGGQFSNYNGLTNNYCCKINSNGNIFTGVVNIIITGSSNQRVINYLSSTNYSAKANVSLNYNSGANSYTLWNGRLAPNEKLEYTNGEGFTTYDLSGAEKTEVNNAPNPITQPLTKKTLSNDVINNNAVANTLQSITGLSFTVSSGHTYYFKFTFPYTSAVATTGSRWTLTGVTTSRLNYKSTYCVTTTTQTINYATAYGVPAAANASSLTDGNVAIIEGILKATANGSITPMFASEVLSSAITAKAGSTLYYQQIA